MLKLIDILIESKQVGILYHNTSVDRAKKILETNKFEAFLNDSNILTDFRYQTPGKDFLITPFGPIVTDRYKHKKYVSFTRNKFYIRTFDNVQFIIDGNKLSENYKIVPYSQFGGREHDESEERVYKDINNLSKYLLKIIIPQEQPELEYLLEKRNIPYEINLK